MFNYWHYYFGNRNSINYRMPRDSTLYQEQRLWAERLRDMLKDAAGLRGSTYGTDFTMLACILAHDDIQRS